jgi:hypothetical protein
MVSSDFLRSSSKNKGAAAATTKDLMMIRERRSVLKHGKMKTHLAAAAAS